MANRVCAVVISLLHYVQGWHVCSQVAALAAGAGVDIDVEKPYAELWCVINLDH